MDITKRMKMRTTLSFISYVSILCAILAAQSYSVADATLENGTLTVPISNLDVTGKDFGNSQSNPSPPSKPVRLIFMHHSTGENWLSDENGGLGKALRDNNYFVSDTNYDWGPDSIGSLTDIGAWWLWFRGPNCNKYMNALYAESTQHCEYSRLPNNPGGQNEIVMFKSCFPNSALKGNSGYPVPPIASNPLRGQDSGSDYHTVANAKGIYIDILEYFRNHQEKLFIVISAPPLSDPEYSGNARAFNQWLVNDWLKGYPYHNVFVFDFYDILTTNGGNPNVNDLNKETGNHHRLWNGVIQHKIDGDDDPNPNILEYQSEDDHPSQAGNLKATAEFLPLLNIAYNNWRQSNYGIGRFRPSTHRWYLDYDNNGASNYKVTWGASTDKPVAGDWDGDGKDEIGLFRPSTARWYLDYDNNGASNYQVTWGASTDIPVAGCWS